MAKDPADRYQRGADFASDLHQLRLEFTTSITGMGTRVSNTTGTLKALSTVYHQDPPKGLEHAQQLVQTAIRNARTRDFLLASALVALMILVAIPSRRA